MMPDIDGIEVARRLKADVATEWFGDLTTLSGDQGAKAILEKHRQQVMLCPVDDPGVIRDIDRPADLVASPQG